MKECDDVDVLQKRLALAEKAARNWKLAAKALRVMLIMAGVRKSFYRPRWNRK